ncbi:MAG: hypothetical protein JWM68_3494 [Verrucomicrobiales bacterium]|nr:hypothetical protein [Verrucomicrobiales bacterium]
MRQPQESPTVIGNVWLVNLTDDNGDHPMWIHVVVIQLPGRRPLHGGMVF